LKAKRDDITEYNMFRTKSASVKMQLGFSATLRFEQGGPSWGAVSI
jgi:hypothetical protein